MFETDTASEETGTRRNDADGCGGAMYMQLNVPEVEDSSKEELAGDEFTFVFEDVKFSNSDAIKGASVYVTTNDQSVLNRSTWSNLVPSSSSSSAFTLSVVNQTEEAHDVSFSEWINSANSSNTSEKSTQSSASGGSSSEGGVSDGETALIVLMVFVLIILVCFLVFFLLCCLSCSPFYYKGKKEEEDKSEEAGADPSTSSTEMHESTSEPPQEEVHDEPTIQAKETEMQETTPQEEEQHYQADDQNTYSQTAYPDNTDASTDETSDVTDDNI